jgi:PTS system cellobiose-specific IIB component
MQTAAKAENIDLTIFSASTKGADELLDKQNVSVLLLGPQVRFLHSHFEGKLAKKDIPFDVVKSQDYGMMDGVSVLHQALDFMNNK